MIKIGGIYGEKLYGENHFNNFFIIISQKLKIVKFTRIESISIEDIPSNKLLNEVLQEKWNKGDYIPIYATYEEQMEKSICGYLGQIDEELLKKIQGM